MRVAPGAGHEEDTQKEELHSTEKEGRSTNNGNFTKLKSATSAT